jgi:hypothetical protein
VSEFLQHFHAFCKDNEHILGTMNEIYRLMYSIMIVIDAFLTIMSAGVWEYMTCLYQNEKVLTPRISIY